MDEKQIILEILSMIRDITYMLDVKETDFLADKAKAIYDRASLLEGYLR